MAINLQLHLQEEKMKSLQKIVMMCLMTALLMVTLPLAAVDSTVKNTAGVDPQEKLVNINSAPVQELSSLPRIGVRIAERIVQFRKENGPFKRKQDIMKVKGIGEKVFELIEKRITV